MVHSNKDNTEYTGSAHAGCDAFNDTGYEDTQVSTSLHGIIQDSVIVEDRQDRPTCGQVGDQEVDDESETRTKVITLDDLFKHSTNGPTRVDFHLFKN